MSASISKETECGDGVINTEGADNDSDSPVVSRTRSGRRLRTPAAKTPVRRTRKSTVREDPAESIESQQEAQSEETNADPKVTETTLTVTVSDQTSEKENVVNNTETGSNDTEKKAKKRTHSESSEKSKMVPLGKPKSGKVWKDRTKQRFSALVRDKPLCTSWQKKMEAKREKQLVKQFQQQLKDEQARQKEEKRKRRAENLQRRAENERKAEIVQVIKNTTKIKRMKKKQLRKIEKRDTLSMVQKTPPKVK